MNKQFKVEQTTTGLKLRLLETTKTGKIKSRVLGIRLNYDEVDKLIDQYS